MKSTYLVHISLPEVFTSRLAALIPKQRSTINDLLEQRVVLSYSLDMERQNLWVFVEAKSEKGVMDIISNFPIINEVKVEIKELAFYDSSPMGLPELIMN
ncbi:MAG: hypothetical protein J0L69_15085 [Bacteroidetes bacterium]|nr:hypothetical protein [Bacteroidota bacterium]